ncbi:hypothetical protein GCM10011309_14790 [Litorimonas cladophorae]|uniref:Uncharacterized protein n=1 Tax=Litorimonas cladophorae TaxID=1220491 RepID=A0A918KJJ9_9PROT|nr:hypothetical protein [Litorimonas cladophorae]GGX65575.1 hypothetical protein GCM10011309_14790 [Litorimonas cladophorae]
MTETPFHTKHHSKPVENSRLSNIWDAAETYGRRSFDNYAQIRSVAETLRDLLCVWLNKGDEPCVYLVPPEGPFEAQNYQSGAFSVSGKGYLPLRPISFGLAVRISQDKDYMRLVIHCEKQGDQMKVSVGKERAMGLQLPLDESQLTPLFDRIYNHVLSFFKDSVDQYDEGDYGTSAIGFDIYRVTE